jgi:hypothetical protein
MAFAVRRRLPDVEIRKSSNLRGLLTVLIVYVHVYTLFSYVVFSVFIVIEPHNLTPV